MKKKESVKAEGIKTKEETLRSELEKYRKLRNCSPSIAKSISYERRLKLAETKKLSSSEGQQSLINVNIISNVLSPQTIASLEKINEHQNFVEKKEKPFAKRNRNQCSSMDFRGVVSPFPFENSAVEEKSGGKSKNCSQGKCEAAKNNAKEKSPIKDFTKYKTTQSQKEKEILSFYSNLVQGSLEGNRTNEETCQKKPSSQATIRREKFSSGQDFSEEEVPLFSDERTTLNTESEKKRSLEKIDGVNASSIYYAGKVARCSSVNQERETLRLEVEKWKKFGNLMADAHEEINEKYKEALKNLEEKSRLADSLGEKLAKLEGVLKEKESQIKSIELERVTLEEERKMKRTGIYSESLVSSLEARLSKIQQENEQLQSENQSLKRNLHESQFHESRRCERDMSESTILAQELINLRTELDRLQSENKRLSRNDSLGSLSREKMKSFDSKFKEAPVHPAEGRASLGGDKIKRSTPRDSGNEEQKSFFGAKEFSSISSVFGTPERSEVRNLYSQFQKEAGSKIERSEKRKPFFF